jgi:hypothetical protein
MLAKATGWTGAHPIQGIQGKTKRFEDKDECVAIYERFSDRVVGRVTERCANGKEWPQRVRFGLEALLEELAADPATTEAISRAWPAIRPSAHDHYLGLLETLASFLSGGRRFAPHGAELPTETEMLAVGAAETLIFDEVGARRAAQLPALLPALLFSVLVPFLGPEQASEEMRLAAA